MSNLDRFSSLVILGDQLLRRWSRILKTGGEFWPGQWQRNVAKAWKQHVFGLPAGQCVCALKMNKLIGRTSHRLCTFSSSIRQIREIKYYFNLWGIRKKKKERRGAQRKGGKNSPVSPPLDPRLLLFVFLIHNLCEKGPDDKTCDFE